MQIFQYSLPKMQAVLFPTNFIYLECFGREHRDQYSCWIQSLTCLSFELCDLGVLIGFNIRKCACFHWKQRSDMWSFLCGYNINHSSYISPVHISQWLYQPLADHPIYTILTSMRLRIIVYRWLSDGCLRLLCHSLMAAWDPHTIPSVQSSHPRGWQSR